MGLRERKAWEAYNLAKERRRMERVALQVVPAKCEDCGGNGRDPGSLHEPEACPSCLGSGVEVPAEGIERKAMGRAE